MSTGAPNRRLSPTVEDWSSKCAPSGHQDLEKSWSDNFVAPNLSEVGLGIGSPNS